MKKKIKKMIVTMILLMVFAAIARPCDVHAASTKKAADAVRTYNKYICTKKYKRYTKTTKNIAFMSDTTNDNLYNYLPDLNHDGVPELILCKEEDSCYYIFTYRKKKVEFVKKFAMKKKRSNDSIILDGTSNMLLYHTAKKEFYILEMDLSTLEKVLEEFVFEKAESGKWPEITDQVLYSLGAKIRESTYRVSSSGQKIRKVKNSELRITNTKDGIVFKLNAKERFRCRVYVNGEQLNKEVINNEDLKLDSMRMEFSVPKIQTRLAVSWNLGGYTRDEIQEVDYDEWEKLSVPKYYYGMKELTEEKAEKKLEEMTSFLNNMVGFSTSEKYHKLGWSEIDSRSLNSYFKPRPERVRLTYSWIRLRVGKTAKPSVRTVVPADAGRELLLWSSNEKVVKITASEKIKAVKPGKATVYVTNEMNPKIELKIKVTVRK